MKEQTYGEILAALVAKFGANHDMDRIHRRWKVIGSGAKADPAWMIGTKYI